MSEKVGGNEPETSGAPQADADALFKAQMALADVGLKYWKHAFGVILLVLAGVFVRGQWTEHVAESNRASFSSIAKVDRAVPDAFTMGPNGPETLTDADATARLVKAADEYVVIAGRANGASAVEAWLKAADAYRRVGDSGKQLSALTAAASLEAEGAVAYGADLAYARALVATGKVDEAMAHLRTTAGAMTGFYGEQALLELARVQVDADKKDDARRTLDEFKARFGASKDAVAVKALESRLAGPASGGPPAAEPAVAPVPPPAQPAASGNGG